MGRLWGFCSLSSRYTPRPACNQLLHYVVLTVRTAGFQRNDRATGSPRWQPIPGRMTTPSQRRRRSEARGGGGKCPLSPLVGCLPLTWRRSVPGDLLQSRSYFKANKINKPQIPGPIWTMAGDVTLRKDVHPLRMCSPTSNPGQEPDSKGDAGSATQVTILG